MAKASELMLAEADLGVLHEFPTNEAKYEGLAKICEHFWIVRVPAHPPGSSSTSDFSTVIIARKDKFDKPEEKDLQLFKDERDNINDRCLACTFTCKNDDKATCHVIGVHLPSKGYDLSKEDELRRAHHIAEQLEKAIQDDTMLGIDANGDPSAKEILPLKDAAGNPRTKLAAMFEQAKWVDKNLASTNKERTPIQCQVSKTFLPDVSRKDFIFLGPAFKGKFNIKGYIAAGERLPSARIPSDHALLYVEYSPYAAWIRGGGGREEIEKHKTNSDSIEREITGRRAGKTREPWDLDGVFTACELESVQEVGQYRIKPVYDALMNQSSKISIRSLPRPRKQTSCFLQ